MWNLDGAVVPVTGAAAGIGLATCRQLRAAGATPLLLDLDAEGLRRAAREVFPDLDDARAARFCYRLDIASLDDVELCLEAIRRDHGPVTHAVSNAGISGPGTILDISTEQWRRTMDVNLDGTMYFCRAAVRQIAGQGRGAMVLTASVAGLRTKPGILAYSTSKAAMINFTRSLALDLGDHNVRVNAVAPGIIDTPRQQKRSGEMLKSVVGRGALKRQGTADEIANVVMFLLSDLSSYVTGHTVVADGGLSVNYA